MVIEYQWRLETLIAPRAACAFGYIQVSVCFLGISASSSGGGYTINCTLTGAIAISFDGPGWPPGRMLYQGDENVLRAKSSSNTKSMQELKTGGECPPHLGLVLPCLYHSPLAITQIKNTHTIASSFNLCIIDQYRTSICRIYIPLTNYPLYSSICFGRFLILVNSGLAPRAGEE